MPGIPSYDRFSYALRPSKQVERKLLVEALRALDRGGLKIARYLYVGLGSPYFVDFILFHKLLGIKSMICVEHDDIPRRMRFNRPFPFVRIRMRSFASVLPDLPRRRPMLVWLDYDDPVSESMFEDIEGLIYVAAPKSILVVTANCEPRVLAKPNSPDEETRVASILARLGPTVGRYRSIHGSEVTRANLPRTLSDGVLTHMKEAASKRADLDFYPFLSHSYADGHQMVTLAGILGEKGTPAVMMRSGVFDLSFCSPNPVPMSISVPPVTERERQWLEQHVRDSWKVDRVRFEIDETIFESFKKVRRYYPTYVETLL